MGSIIRWVCVPIDRTGRQGRCYMTARNPVRECSAGASPTCSNIFIAGRAEMELASVSLSLSLSLRLGRSRIQFVGFNALACGAVGWHHAHKLIDTPVQASYTKNKRCFCLRQNRSH
jgi:hypothetical protein